MSVAWKNNPNGVCEDAPCCGCCGPQGDGAFDPEFRAFEAELDDEARFYEDGDFDPDEEDGEPSDHFAEEPSPDPYWMND